MKSVSKTTKIAVGAAILAVGGFSGIGLANAAQMSSTEQAEVNHATPATPAVPATPTLPAKPAVPAVPAAPSTDGNAKGDADVDGTEGAVDGSVDSKKGATVKGDASVKGAAGEARANANVNAAVPATPAIPGAKGVGASTAASLLRKYGSLERALAEGRFAQQADELRLYRVIATMDRTSPLPKLRKQAPQWARASALAQEWGFNQLANRLAGLSQAV